MNQNLQSLTIQEQLEKIKERITPPAPITLEEVRQVLDLTIKKDDENKIITFLAMLAAYTDNAQFNISFNAPSSSGKSFIPLEISHLFPADDVMKLAGASPTSFLHETGVYNKETNERFIDLSRKIIIFLDMPHSSLLTRLRALLSHDEKISKHKITDKTEKGGTRTKTAVIQGFPSVIFCSANAKMDQQEMTRFILLSPQIGADKVFMGIQQSSKKEANKKKYYKELNENPIRKALIDRIAAIKGFGIEEIIIEDEKAVQERFLAKVPNPQPRHQRDIKRVYSIIKAIALLNPWQRKVEGTTLYASNEDIEAGFGVWDKISLFQELEISPYLYEFYQRVILPVWNMDQVDDFGERVPEEKKLGINRQAMLSQYVHVYGTNIGMYRLRNDYLPGIMTAGLIYEEPDPNDRRQILVYPAHAKRKADTPAENHSAPQSGVSEPETSQENKATDVPF
ncbi:MAG: hypothetical protein V4481_03875 [Patescibacteria group bacterium]